MPAVVGNPAARPAGCVYNPMMQIELNGQSLEVADGITFADLIDAQGLGSARVAIEANGAIVPRSAHATRALQAGDRIEIVHALGGG